MIRRKLTRIEVTLDDTKDLDDYFSKAATAANNSVIGSGTAVGTTPACATKTPSQLYQLYTKQHYTGANNTTTGQQSALDISIDQQQSSLTGSLSNRATGDNFPTDSIGNLIANLTPSATTTEQQQQDSADLLSYNPQPHNQFDRFNQNI